MIILELIDAYLNGPRTLSNTRLSYLILSKSPAQSDPNIPSPPPTPPTSDKENLENADQIHLAEDAGQTIYQHDLLICAMHFLGDGMALHAFANDFFGLLGSDKSDEQLRQKLTEEWTARWAVSPQDVRSQRPGFCSRLTYFLSPRRRYYPVRLKTISP